MATDINIQSPIPVPISGHVVVDTGSIAIGNAITIDNFPLTYPITGTVNIGNLPSLQQVEVSNFPTLQLVSITNAPLSVAGSVNVLNFPAVLPTTVANFPAIQAVSITGTPLPVSGAVSILNFPSVQPVSGAVSVTNFSGSVDISDRVARSLGHVVVDSMPPVNVGAISISNFPSTQVVDTVDRPARLNGHVTVDNFPASQPVTFSGGVDVTDRAARLVGHVTVDALPSVAISNFPATQLISGTVSVGNFPATQPVSVSNFPATQAVSIPVVPSRQAVMLSWERLAGVAAESALANFTNGTLNAIALAAASSYTVSAGKTLRITAINVSAVATANTLFNSRMRIRQAAAVTNASPIIWQGEISIGSATAAAIEGFSECFNVPGGIEVAAGQQITFTHLESSATGTVSLVIVGYEY